MLYAVKIWGGSIAMCLVLILSVLIKINAQELDSLLKELSKNTLDTEKVKILYQITEVCEEKEMIPYAQKALKILENIKNTDSKTKLFIEKYKGRLISNVAFAKNIHGEVKSAIDLYYAALKHTEKANDIENMSTIYNNLGMIFKRLGKYDKALDFLKKAINFKLKSNSDLKNLATSYANLGEIYSLLHYKDSNEYYQSKALAIRMRANDKPAIGRSFKSLGDIAFAKKDFLNAEMYYKGAIQNLENSYERRVLADSYIALANYYLYFNKDNEAEKFIKKAELLSKEDSFPDHLARTALLQYQLAEKRKDYKNALQYYKTWKVLNDSIINNSVNEKAITAMLLKQFEQAEQELKAQQEKKLLIEKQEKERAQLFFIFAVILFLVMAILSFFIYSRWKLTQKQNKIIEEQRKSLSEQHQLLTHKNQAIADSINYASAIQYAFLLPRGDLNTITGKDVMLLFKPKDVVSGDFYWFKKINEYLIFVVADSTGHGVPGAFISLVSIKAIEAIITKLKDLTKVDEIIYYLDEELQKISNSHKGAKAGLDMVLGCLNTNTNELIVTGSRNSMYLVKNQKLYDYKFDNYFIGSPDKFGSTLKTIKIQVEPNDVIYCTTDGYPDQKGEATRTKFFLQPFRSLLLSIHQKSVKEQRKILEETFDKWKGNLEQIDDVCVVGIKI